MALLDDVRRELSITSTAKDAVISDLILSAKADLGICGLLTISETDPLIKRAIILYCKANFAENEYSARLQMNYEMLRNHLSTSTDYAYFSVTFTVKDSSDVAIGNSEVTFDNEAKTTNASGVAIFYVRAGNNYQYTVSAENYSSDDDEDNLIDVSANTTVAITLSGV